MKSLKELKDLPEEELNRISPFVLQRKFKLSQSMAKEICDFLYVSRLESGWFDVKVKPPKEYNVEMLVFGKPISSVEVSLGYFIAFHSPCSGWVKKDDRNCLLYVTHYQLIKIPKEEILIRDLDLVDLVVGRRNPTQEN